MRLSDVSKTAIITLRSHAAESRRKQPLIDDPMAEFCLGRLEALASEEEKKDLFNRRLNRALTAHVVIRARKYDAIANAFIREHPGCTVVNLGCGFDTRYWRIEHQRCEYFDLDLPEVIALKKEILLEHDEYEMIGSSVLDRAWIDRITARSSSDCLLIAEGLFMYLPQDQVEALFLELAQRFYNSQIVLEVVTEKYTHGLWKKIVEYKFRSEMGSEAGSAYQFGVSRASDIETYGPGLKVIDEWSYFEDKDTSLRFLKYLGLSRTQWTVVVIINADRPTGMGRT